MELLTLALPAGWKSDLHDTEKEMPAGLTHRVLVLVSLLGFLWTVPELVSVRPASPTMEAQMFSLALKKGPTARQLQQKEHALSVVRKVAESRWSNHDVEVIPFGSSVTGLGEGSSDVDVVLFFPNGGPPPLEALRGLKQKLERQPDTKVLQSLLREKMKIPLLRLLIQGVQCDLTCQNVLPVFNTVLLRGYGSLCPKLNVLAIVIKRWAKKCRIGEVQNGFISSYTWTLMMIYYLQVCHGLPSLHVLSPHQALHRTPKNKTFAFGFLSTENRQKVRTPLNDLLRGFYEFYSEHFDWEYEVVSVRLGRRLSCKDSEFRLLPRKHLKAPRKKPKGPGIPLKTEGYPNILKVEDPIEISRNLNFALIPRTCDKIRSSIAAAFKSFQGPDAWCCLLGSL